MHLRLMATVAFALLIGCSSAPAEDPNGGQPAVGGQAALQLCDPENPAGLPALVAEADRFRETGDSAQLAAMMETTLSLIVQLELEEATDPARWRAAGEDAVRQLQRRIDDPKRALEVARHAVRTLGILQDHICG